MSRLRFDFEEKKVHVRYETVGIFQLYRSSVSLLQGCNLDIDDFDHVVTVDRLWRESTLYNKFDRFRFNLTVEQAIAMLKENARVQEGSSST